MQKCNRTGWWLPDGETHLIDWMVKSKQKCDGGRLGYQMHKLNRCMDEVPEGRRRVAVDVGAHVGLWSWPLAHRFRRVVGFEPMPEHIDCWHMNMAGVGGSLHPVAIGESHRQVSIATRTEGSSGDTGIDGTGLEVEMWTLDSFGLDEVDFIKVDTEGYEPFVIDGARETIARCRPACIVVEQKPETGGHLRYGTTVTAAVELLETMGYRRAAVLQGDYIMVPR
jgi:FkbM family methyltransferase